MIEKTLFTKEVICDEVKKHYGIEIKQIQVVNGGSANIYKLLSTEDKQYILKEFQSKYSYQTILKEIHVIDFLKGMIPHHQGAVDVSKKILEYTKDEKIKEIANRIISAQEKEISDMNNLLSTLTNN